MVHNGNDGADERKEDGMYGGNVDSVNNGSGDVEGATNTECSVDETFRDSFTFTFSMPLTRWCFSARTLRALAPHRSLKAMVKEK